MKNAKKLLAVLMALAMVATFAAMAFAASPSVKFAVGEYNTEKGRVAVTGYFNDCVGLKSGKIKFGYADGDVTKITSADGADADNARKLGNACTYEFNAGINPAEFGFYYKEVLWATSDWDAAADDLEVDAKVNGENFEFATFNFTAKPGAVITVTGELVFDGSTIALNQSFKIPGEPETTTAKKQDDETTTTERAVDIDPGVSPCKDSLVKTARVEPTCTKTGNIEYYTCSHCGKVYSDKDGKNLVTNVIIPATGHKYGEWVITKEATKTEQGVKTKTCSVCGDVKTELIPIIVDETTTAEPTTCDGGKVTPHYYTGGNDCFGKKIIGWEPLTGWAIVEDEFGKPVRTDDPNARRSVILDDTGSSGSSSVVGSSSGNGTSSSSANASSSSASSSGSKTTGSVNASVKTDGGKKTGDSGVLAIFAGVVALAGAAFVVTKKRK